MPLSLPNLCYLDKNKTVLLFFFPLLAVHKRTSGNQWSREAPLMSLFHAPAVFVLPALQIGGKLEDELKNIPFILAVIVITYAPPSGMEKNSVNCAIS